MENHNTAESVVKEVLEFVEKHDGVYSHDNVKSLITEISNCLKGYTYLEAEVALESLLSTVRSFQEEKVRMLESEIRERG